jgi:hypothetical protein
VNVLRLIKCGLYSVLGLSDLTAQNPDAKPSFITMQNLQTDYSKDNSIYFRDARDLKLSDIYANTSLIGDIINLGPGVTEATVSRARLCGAKKRLITINGARSVKFTESSGWNWNAQGGNGAAIGVGGAFDDFLLSDSTFGTVADQTTPNLGPCLVVDSSTTGKVRAHDNLTVGCGNEAQAFVNNSTGPARIYGTNICV